jgi:hypothetical protein
MPARCTKDVFLRDLDAGEEVLDDYLYLVTPDERIEFAAWLSILCATGDAAGSIYEIESARS